LLDRDEISRIIFTVAAGITSQEKNTCTARRLHSTVAIRKFKTRCLSEVWSLPKTAIIPSSAEALYCQLQPDLASHGWYGKPHYKLLAVKILSSCPDLDPTRELPPNLAAHIRYSRSISKQACPHMSMSAHSYATLSCNNVTEGIHCLTSNGVMEWH
jgi:hypothetical protein